MTDERRNGNGRRSYDDQDVLLARIDENVKSMKTQMTTFVTKDEFRPVRAVAYGMVSLLMGALIFFIVASALT